MNQDEKVNAEKSFTPFRTIGDIPVHNFTKDSFQMKKIRWSKAEINLYLSNLPEYITLEKRYKNGEISFNEGINETRRIQAEYDDQFYSYY